MQIYRDRERAEIQVQVLELDGHRMHPKPVYGRHDDVVAVEYHPTP